MKAMRPEATFPTGAAPRRPTFTAALVAAAGLLLGLAASPATAQDKTFQQTSDSAKADLEAALRELSQARERITAEKLPLSRKLSAAESRLMALRAEFQDVGRDLDNKSLELGNITTEVDAQGKEKGYLSGLLEEYSRNFESQLHIAELARYRERVEAASNAPDDAALSTAEVYRRQTDLVLASADRLLELVGGQALDGAAVGPDGRVRQVRLALIGPVALFESAEGDAAGMVEQRLGSLEPNMVPFDEPERTAEVHKIVSMGSGRLPLDPSLGNARKIAAAQDSLFEQAAKGGPVVIPILLLAAAALIVAVLKWFQLARVPVPGAKRIDALLVSLKKGNHAAVEGQLADMPGPTGRMLRAGMEHITEPRELVEEVMYETALETRLKLQGFLPFIAVSAASAPLLGLLGTVTGIINTFKLITVFGTGDASTLSSGISEALITTEFGLIVAIPSLLLHAFLSRKAKRLIDGMEKTAVSFLNRIGVSQPAVFRGPSGADGRQAVPTRAVGRLEPAMAGAGAWVGGREKAADH